MWMSQHKAGQSLTRLSLRNPERLWIHYCIALLMIFCLIVATHYLNRSAMVRGLEAAEGIRHSNEQIFIAQDILSRASALTSDSTPNFDDFNALVSQLETIHRSLVASRLRSEALKEYYFGEETLHYLRITQFLDLARTFADAPENQRAATLDQMKDLYTTGGLHDGLVVAATLFADVVKEKSARVTTLQTSILIASALVLLAEAVLIFLPAQIAVQATIGQLQKQTSVLRDSQMKLKQTNLRLEHLVHHDQLTGLPNRQSLIDYLTQVAKQQGEDEQTLLSIGLDDFKSVNDSIGHDYGDALLVSVGRALQHCVDVENLIARMGGDEFVIVTNEHPQSVIKRIMACFVEPFEIKGRRIQIKASIGYAAISYPVSQPLELVADAQIALHHAKSAGGNRAEPYSPALRTDIELMHKLQIELRDAIKNGEIEPWFQPQVRLSDGQLHGAEVLARWRHPTRGLLTPNVFLPAAERAGLMADLDLAIWTSAMDHAHHWQASNLWRPSISLNAAPDTISNPDFIERFLLALHRSGLATGQVVVEVLETTLIDGKDDMAAINIDSLAECGIGLELDDFGTGYASLSRLTQLPLSGIKLDRSLVAPLPDQAADSVVRAILALASELGLHVIAEGVELLEQAEHLNQYGCIVGQGYGFGRPMPPAEFATWLAANAKQTLLDGLEYPPAAARA